MLLRVLLVMVMIGSLGVAGTVLLRANTRIDSAEAALAPDRSTYVLVASRNLSTGTLLQKEDVRWEPWAMAEAPSGYFVRDGDKVDAALGSVIRRPFVAGEPILAGQLVAPGERGFLAAVLTPGMRAVAVAVDAVSAASGLIWPGDRVDLILTQFFADGQANGQKAAGETFLRDLRVLSIDQQLGEAMSSEPGLERQAPRTVTLEVTPRQAELLKVATGLGQIALALRSINPDEKVGMAQEPVWASDVSAALRSTTAPPAGSAPAPTVEILRGSSRVQ